MKGFFRELYFLFIAILMLLELFVGNIFSLLFLTDRIAELADISLEAARTRLSILAALDAIPGISAAIVFMAYRKIGFVKVGHIAVVFTSLGMVAYACYQIWLATNHPDNFYDYRMMVGIVYTFFGIIALFVGSNLRQGIKLPNQLT